MDRHTKLGIWKWSLRLVDVALLIALASVAYRVQCAFGVSSLQVGGNFPPTSLQLPSKLSLTRLAHLVLLTYLVFLPLIDPIRRRIMGSWATAGPRVTKMCFMHTAMLLVIFALHDQTSPGRYFVISYFLLITLAEIPFRYYTHSLVNEILEDMPEIRKCEIRLLKRLLDIIASIVAMLTIFPVLYVIAAIIIKAKNTGPVLKWVEQENGKGERVNACHFCLPQGMDDSWLAHMPRLFAILMGRMTLADLKLENTAGNETENITTEEENEIENITIEEENDNEYIQ